MVCLHDIGDLLDLEMKGFDMMAKAEAHKERGDQFWGMSAVLFNCASSKFDINLFADEIEKNEYGFKDLHMITPKFLEKHPYRLGEIDPNWNSFDYYDDNTKLIHYTDLFTQPWKYAHHKYGDIWFEYFEEARNAGLITQKDIERSISRSYMRPDIFRGNSPPYGVKNALTLFLAELKKKFS